MVTKKIKNRQPNKVKSIRSIGFTLTSLLILVMTGLLIGCSSPVTNVDTFDSPMVQMQSVSDDIYWFVEKHDNGNTRSDPMQILLQYLKDQGNDLDIDELEQFIIENIGDLEIIIDRDEAHEKDIALNSSGKEITTINLPDGSKIIIIIYD